LVTESLVSRERQRNRLNKRVVRKGTKLFELGTKLFELA